MKATIRVPHAARQGDNAADEVCVIGRGRYAYLWLGKGGVCRVYVSGPATLRRIRDALTEALGESEGDQ